MVKAKQIAKKIMIVILCIYRYCISPILGNNCRFYPTCSQYAIDAINTHGVSVGMWLTLKRILHCHPWCKGGYDPVPPKTNF